MTAPVVRLDDRACIEAVLRRNAPVHIYAIGDLDDFFWPRTTWYALDTPRPDEVALLYRAHEAATLLLLEDTPGSRPLLAAIAPLLPPRFYAHLHPDLVPTLAQSHRFESKGMYEKMLLDDTDGIQQLGCPEAQVLGPDDLEELRELYEQSYPDHAFDSRMLETGQYVGLRLRGSLVSVAGVHVFSPRYGVAALGNVTTHPAARGRGWGRRVTARCCQQLLTTVSMIGLNVRADNLPALCCYRSLGFQRVHRYVEGWATART